MCASFRYACASNYLHSGHKRNDEESALTHVTSSHTGLLNKIKLNLHKDRVRFLEYYLACLHQDGRCFLLSEHRHVRTLFISKIVFLVLTQVIDGHVSPPKEKGDYF